MCIVLPLGYSPLTLSSTVIHFVCASPVAHVARRLTAHTVHYRIIITLYQHQWNGIEYYPSRERVRSWQGENWEQNASKILPGGK